MHTFTALWLSALDAKYLTWKLIRVIMAKLPLKRLPRVWSHSYDFPRGHWMQSDSHQWLFTLHCYYRIQIKLSWNYKCKPVHSLLFWLPLTVDGFLVSEEVSLLLKQVVTFKFNPFQKLCLQKRAFSIQFISLRSWTRLFKICGHKPFNIYLGHYAPRYYLWVLSVFLNPLSTV